MWTLDDFILGKVMGEGCFDTVYLAKNIHNGKEYAIKVIQKDLENKEETILREKEALICCQQHVYSSSLDSSNGFVKLYATFQDDQNHYFVFSYAKNGELLQHINRVGSFELKVVKHYAAELLLALERMHASGVIHRDLNPENILLDERMHLQIADFGYAQIQSRTVETTHIPPNGESTASTVIQRKKSYIKKPVQYLSPELVKSIKTTKAADLWAFGCIIYTMVSGDPPFRDSNDFLTLVKITKLDYHFPNKFPSNAKDLVEKLLVLEASERLGAKDEGDEYKSIKNHPFFEGIDWDNLFNIDPPPIEVSTISRLNHFIFEKVIAEGRFSTVYLAKDINTKREYAIKHFRNYQDNKESILREKEALISLNDCRQHISNSSLDCSNGFVKLYTTFHMNQSLYFVLSYAKNGQLFQQINRVGSFNLQVAKHYAADLLLALEKMHAKGIIHKGLNPENILLDEKMHLQIAGFGLAKIVSRTAEIPPNYPNDESICLTATQCAKRNIKQAIQYFSPEQVFSIESTRAADLWAFGCIVYTIITGFSPFNDSTDFNTLMKIVKINYYFPKGFPADAKDLVSKLLVLEASERLGAKDNGEEYRSIRNHPFFEGIDWVNLYDNDPPTIVPNSLEFQRIDIAVPRLETLV